MQCRKNIAVEDNKKQTNITNFTNIYVYVYVYIYIYIYIYIYTNLYTYIICSEND